jgi:hypothetical protein
MDWKDVWLQPLNAFFGAGLGACFYILLSTQPYLTTRSFDPKYNAIYTARFVTGLVAGLILAIALSPVLNGSLAKSSFPLTTGVLAILGGYAAEAVQQILQRLVEVLLAAVRGDGSAQAQSKAETAIRQRENRLQKLLIEYERETDPIKKKSLLAQTHELLGSSLPV